MPPDSRLPVTPPATDIASAPPTPTSFPQRTRPLILLADDEVDVLLVARTRLEVSGFEVETAEDGEEAIARFRARRPDLVLLDLRMPKMDGYKVCQMLKSHADTSSVPVIIFSASSSQPRDLEQVCRELGADDYIRKPYSSDELVAKVRLHLGRRNPN